MKKTLLLFLSLFSCGNTFYQNIDNISKSFKDKPYINNPLGENKGIDKDPLYRYDAFDCLTYVETMLALSLTKNEEDFKKILTKIRYKDGEVLFENRNHFVNPDWIENNKEYITDITEILSNTLLNIKPDEIKLTLDKKTWFKQNHNIDVKIKPQEIKLNYISLDNILLNKDKFITGINKPIIITLVINNPKLKEQIGTNLDISHIGFIIPTEKTLILRHASLTKKKVVDVDFFEYLNGLKKYPIYIGINFLEIKS